MDRAGFEALRNLPDKQILSDIQFTLNRDSSPNLTFDEVAVDNSLGLDVILNGTYKPGIPSLTLNFRVRGVGPICRICVNGKSHGDAGRTHKHDLHTPDCPRLNLPMAVARPDLENQPPSEIWRILCSLARIDHTGTFIDPS